MVGSMGGAAKEAKKASMKEIHDSWKERWWGAAQLQILSTLDLQQAWGGPECVSLRGPGKLMCEGDVKVGRGHAGGRNHARGAAASVRRPSCPARLS